ncbi:oligopeptide ABC transporter permease protein [Ligilactobacillus salitolerans]|uniref:Oligopeptide ABC transporter permease protein n=1 Tax=Ligilactobacillus salitolerans TaxID=1808352 RepID=A0A401ISA0_9LACO|nr:ABC transporter permease [Ligilactobacillus salitolerans]GBG94401.1 oligopeptide ABC transporter permease protein [Ligilactobacillus salitolerans]
MKKYVFFRVLRSIVSIFLVTTITYILIYTLIPKRAVFDQDPLIQKLASDPDKLLDYKNTAYHKMNYLDYQDTKSLVAKAKKAAPGTEVSGKRSQQNFKVLNKWAKENGYQVKTYPKSKRYYATRDLPLWERLGRFYGDLIQVDTPWSVHDKNNPHLKRYLKIKKDKWVGWALVGSGTKYRYQIYFNSSFPYIHQNIIHFNLGTSYPTFGGNSVVEVIAGRQGSAVTEKYDLGKGVTINSSDNVYTRQYQTKEHRNGLSYERYKDSYTSLGKNYEDPSMVGTSFKAGIFALLIAYLIAIPMAFFMARYKGKLFDRIGTGVVTVLIAIPSLAFIYAFRFIGSQLFGLPDSFPTEGAGSFNSWVLPTVILGLLSVSGLVIWFRRYMIDQQQSDYVKFARSKGLTDNEIYRKHIFKNASIPIVQQIPGSIIGLISGATITENIFAMPGMGKMLPDAILSHNNSVVIGLVFIFTVIGVLSVLLGDILMAIVDPRINLASKGDD